MSQGQIRGCQMDALQGQVKEIFKKLVDEVCLEEDWKVNTKMGVHEVDVVYGGDKIVYGASIELPTQLAENKYGLNYGPQSSDRQKRLVPFGKSITKEEAAKIRAGDMTILDSEEFKNRPAAIGIDVHDFRDPKMNAEMESRRKRLEDKLSDLGGIATAIDSTIRGSKVIEAAGRLPGGVDAIRDSLVQRAIDAVKSGSAVIQHKVSLLPPKKSPGLLGVQPTPTKPQGQLGLMR